MRPQLVGIISAGTESNSVSNLIVPISSIIISNNPYSHSSSIIARNTLRSNRDLLQLENTSLQTNKLKYDQTTRDASSDLQQLHARPRAWSLRCWVACSANNPTKLPARGRKAVSKMHEAMHSCSEQNQQSKNGKCYIFFILLRLRIYYLFIYFSLLSIVKNSTR